MGNKLVNGIREIKSCIEILRCAQSLIVKSLLSYYVFLVNETRIYSYAIKYIYSTVLYS